MVMMMARGKDGRAPDKVTYLARPYIAEVHLTFKATTEERATNTVMELAAILTAAGYENLHVDLRDPVTGNQVAEFVYVPPEEGDGEDEEDPPTTV